MTDDITEWDDSQCWFCKKRPAVPAAKHEVDLYRVLHRKSTYVVVGMQYKQQYEKTKTWVPRCEHCQRIHDRVALFFLVVWLILGIWGSIWLIGSSGKGYDSSIFSAVIGIVMMFFMCAIPVGFLFMISNAFWKSEDEANNHPRVTILTNQGWEIGDKPPYKWSGPDDEVPNKAIDGD